MIKRITFFILLILFFSISLNAVITKVNIPITKKILSNGLSVYLCDIKYMPAVNVSIYYEVGSKDETDSERGLSHFLEHMMFKTTKNLKTGEYNEIIKSNGGNLNAATSFDFTYYYSVVPKAALEIAIKLEAERMINLTIDEREFEAEKKVILEEIGTRSENNPSGYLWTQFIQNAYKKSTYGKPILGSREQVSAHTPEIMKAFYKKYYAPNNAHLIIVGDIDIDKTFQYAKKYFGHIEKSNIIRPNWMKEPEQTKEQRFTFKKSVQLPQGIIYYNGPDANHIDSAALEMIELILFDGRSSRLVQRLVLQTGLAVNIAGGLYLRVHSAPFSINFIARTKDHFSEIEKIIYEELEKIKNGDISEYLITKAKNKFYSSHLSNFKQISNIANSIGNGAIFGDYKFFFDTRTERILNVTKEDIIRVSKKYFTDKNRSIGFLIPE